MLVGREPLVIGREARAEICLRDPGISRRHAQVLPSSDALVNLIDLGSTNGTFVNGVRIDVVVLREGDEIGVGPEAVLRFGFAEGAALRTPTQAQPLTRRELEVAAFVAKGLGNQEVAERLGVSVRTVTSHLDHIYARLGIGSRAALTRWVVEAGLTGVSPRAPKPAALRR